MLWYKRYMQAPSIRVSKSNTQFCSFDRTLKAFIGIFAIKSWALHYRRLIISIFHPKRLVLGVGDGKYVISNIPPRSKSELCVGSVLPAAEERDEVRPVP